MQQRRHVGVKRIDPTDVRDGNLHASNQRVGQALERRAQHLHPTGRPLPPPRRFGVPNGEQPVGQRQPVEVELMQGIPPPFFRLGVNIWVDGGNAREAVTDPRQGVGTYGCSGQIDPGTIGLAPDERLEFGQVDSGVVVDAADKDAAILAEQLIALRIGLEANGVDAGAQPDDLPQAGAEAAYLPAPFGPGQLSCRVAAFAAWSFHVEHRRRPIAALCPSKPPPPSTRSVASGAAEYRGTCGVLFSRCRPIPISKLVGAGRRLFCGPATIPRWGRGGPLAAAGRRTGPIAAPRVKGVRRIA